MIYTYRPVFIHITTHSRIKVCTRDHLTGEYTDYHLFDRIKCEILTYFDLKTSPMWYNHLLMRNLIFVCMRAQVQVREQVSTSVQQRDELDTRKNVIFYHLFDLDMWLFITYWGRMQYVICTRMYSIMEDLDLRPRYFSVKDTTMIRRW